MKNLSRHLLYNIIPTTLILLILKFVIQNNFNNLVENFIL